MDPESCNQRFGSHHKTDAEVDWLKVDVSPFSAWGITNRTKPGGHIMSEYTGKARTMVKSDLDALVIIENESFLQKDPDFGVLSVSNEAWTKKEISRCAFKEEKTLGWVLEEGEGNIVGYFIWEAVKDGLLIRRLLIHPQYRLAGFGRAVLQKLHEKILEAKVRKTLTAYVNERDVATCKWMAHMKFKSSLVRKGWDDDTDAVKFTFTEVRRTSRPNQRCSK